MASQKKTYKIVELTGSKKGASKDGRYLSTAPMAAAKKAFNQSCRGMKGSCKGTITIVDVTKDSRTKGKEYKYEVHRKKLTVPKERPIGDGGVIAINFETTAKRV